MIPDTKGISRAACPLEGQFVKKVYQHMQTIRFVPFFFHSSWLSFCLRFFFLFSSFSLYLFGPMYLIKCGYLEFGGHVSFSSADLQLDG